MLDWLSPDRQEWYVLTLIPLAAALTSWISVGAVRYLMLAPLRPLGSPPWLGWHGLVLHRQPLYLHTLDSVLRQHLITLPQLYELLSPEKTTQQVINGIRPQLDSLIDDIMLAHHSVLWENLPVTVKNRYYARAHKMIPRIVDDIVEEMGDNIERLLDLPDALTQHFLQRPDQLVELYQQLTQAELYRLSWGAALWQFLFATGLGYLWLVMPQAWLFPLGLLSSALLTGWLWKQSRLRPQRSQTLPRGSWLDLKRYLATLSQSALSARAVAQALLLGNKAKHAHLMIKRHVNTVLDDVSLRTFSQLAMGPEGFADIKQSLAERIPQLYLEALTDTRFNAQRSQSLAQHLIHQAERTAAVHYRALTEPYFADFLRLWHLLMTLLSTTLGLLISVLL